MFSLSQNLKNADQVFAFHPSHYGKITSAKWDTPKQASLPRKLPVL